MNRASLVRTFVVVLFIALLAAPIAFKLHLARQRDERHQQEQNRHAGHDV